VSIYIFLFGLLFIISFAEFVDKKSIDKYNIIILIIIGFILVLFAGTREIGFDYDQYVDMYKVISVTDPFYGIYMIEIGYAFLTSFFNFLGFSFHGFLFSLTSFFIITRLYFFKSLSPYPFLSILLYFTTMFLVTDMGQIRNAVAYAIVMLAYVDYINERKNKFWIKIFIACFCHNSAIILIPALLFLKYFNNFSFKWVLAVFIILLPLNVIDIRIYFQYIIPYLPTDLGIKFNAYLYSTAFGQQLGFNMSFILRSSILFLLFSYRKRGIEKIPYYNWLLDMYVIGVFIFMAFNSVQEFAIRFGNYFKFLELIILPIFVYLTKDKLLKIIIYIIVVMYAIWSLYKLLADPGEGLYYIPYKSLIF